MRAMNDDLRARVTDVLPGLRRDLEDLVRIESVSADPARAGEVRRSAEAVRDLFAAEGFDAEILSEAGGAPAVVAHKRSSDPDARTVLLYAHHDVQPENDHADWDSRAVRADRARRPPVRPRRRRRQGRHRRPPRRRAGSSATTSRSHVTVFVEGEEEVGSESLVPFLAAHRDRLAADVIVIADSINWDIGVPALTTSLRGLVRATVEVRTLTHARALGHVGRPGARRPHRPVAADRQPPRRPTATSRSPACTAGRPPTSTTPRTGSAPSPGAVAGVELDRHRLGRRAALDQARAVDHRRSTHPRSTAPPTPWSRPPAPGSRCGSRPATPRPTPPSGSASTASGTPRGAPS